MTTGEAAADRAVLRTQDHLVGFLRALHAGGLSVPTPKQLDFFTGIETFAPATTGQLYWIGAATLVTSESGRQVYDEVFQAFFGSTADAFVVVDEPADQVDPDDDEQSAASPGEQDGEDVLADQAGGSGLMASRVSPELPKRFAPTDDRAADLMRRVREQFPRAVPTVRSRRSRPGSRRQRVDLRALFLDARRTQGEFVRLHWRHRPARQRRVLLLIDVSGSMKQFSADHLRVAHCVVAACARVEVFTFGTRLTRVTAALRDRDVDAGLAALAQVVLDVDGGTMIGESFQQFLGNAHYVTMARGALVLVLSDGLERGDCTAMTSSVHRLSQLSHQLRWWSPLACDPAYRPLTRGMAAVAGDLDALTGVRDLESALTALTAHPSGRTSHV
jgi:uncharacterized protein with von Willebrand factor type A (vWA) domain